MLPITDFLSCTDPLGEFESLSYHQTRHAKTYVTGLAAGRSKIVTGIAREVLSAGSDRALNKFLTEYERRRSAQPRALRGTAKTR